MPPFEQRAFDPVGRLFMRSLVLPNVYLHAHWPDDAEEVDMLIVDRAGHGDVHVVAFKEHGADKSRTFDPLKRRPGHYLWMAFPSADLTSKTLGKLLAGDQLYLEGGGRIGVIEVVSMAGGDLGAKVVVEAERVPGKLRDQRDAYVASHEADWAHSAP